MIESDKYGISSRSFGRLNRDHGIVRRRELLAVLTREGRAMTVTELAQEIGVTTATLRQAHLRRLERAGAIVREGSTVRLAPVVLGDETTGERGTPVLPISDNSQPGGH